MPGKIHNMKIHRMIIGTASEVAFAACLAALGGCRSAEPSGTGPPTTPAVTVATPIEREITDSNDFTGRVAAPESVEIRPRVDGYLTEVYFTDGMEVDAGAPLFQIDPRPYQAALDRSMAEVERLKAQRDLADVEVRRYEQLARRNAGSREDFDKAAAQAAQAAAGLEAAEAQVEEDRLNLEFTEVTAPIAGRVGRALVTEGNLVTAQGAGGATLLTTVVSVDPMYIYFNPDERAFQQYQRRTLAETGSASRPDLPAAKLPVHAGLASEEGFPHLGVIDFGNNQIDAGTGTISVRGIFPNPDRLLVAGGFARVRVPSGDPFTALLVPERAIGTDQGQKFVLVVDDQDTVEYRRVELGPLTDDESRVIRSGVEADDRVIVNGTLRVRPGMTVVPEAEAAVPEPIGAATDEPPSAPPDDADAPAPGGDGR